MYVCLCHAITEKELDSLIKKGCKTLPDVQKACGLGGSCGTCLQTAREIMLKKKSESSSLKEKLSPLLESLQKQTTTVELGSS